MSAAGAKRTVMIAIDGSKQAEQAFDWYAKFIHKSDNNVILVHSPECATVSMAQGQRLNQGEIQSMMDNEKRETKGIHEKYDKKLEQNKNITMHSYKTAYGSKPGEAIVDASQEVKADMIIMGTRGLGTIRRTIMGSVSDYVVHHASCPVIVCRQ